MVMGTIRTERDCVSQTISGTATTKNRQKTRNAHSPARSGFFAMKQMAVLPVATAEHARVYPLALLVGADETSYRSYTRSACRR